MRALLALAALLLASLPARAAKGPPKASTATVTMVEAFLDTPTRDLPPDKVPEFVEVDPETLPRRLRKRYKAKKLELHTLRQLTDGKKKGTVRTPDEQCDIPRDAKSKEASVIRAAGFMEVEEHEAACVTKRTGCTERDLMCEFSLQIVIERGGKEPRRRLFFHPNDPITAVVAACRDRTGGQTRFFGIGMPVCSH